MLEGFEHPMMKSLYDFNAEEPSRAYRLSDEHLHQQNSYDETNEQLCHLKKLFCRLAPNVLSA